MIYWGSLNLQEGYSTVIEVLNFFHDYIIIILLLILVFVSYIFVYVIYSPYLDNYTIDSHLLETIWTVIPMVILLFIAFPSLVLLYSIEEYYSPNVVVNVMGHQWYWEYQYSNTWVENSFDSYIIHSNSTSDLFYNLDVDNRLVLPVWATILFLVSSADVLHAWTIPSLGINCDAIPGRINSLVTIALSSGIFYGQCSEICGSNHSFIPIVVEMVHMSDYINYISNLS